MPEGRRASSASAAAQQGGSVYAHSPARRMRMARGRQGHEQLAGSAHLVLATSEAPRAQRLCMNCGCCVRGR